MKKTNIGLYYTKGRKFISILIPKIDGVGYLNPTFEGIQPENKFQVFISSKIEGVNYYNIDDLDGFLRVGTNIGWWVDGYDEVVKKVIKVVKDLFPQIESWEEIDGDDFFDIVELNNKIK